MPFHTDEAQMCVSTTPFTNKISKRVGEKQQICREINEVSVFIILVRAKWQFHTGKELTAWGNPTEILKCILKIPTY